MKLAGVSINVNCLPSKEQVIKMALVSTKYYNKKNALESIEKELDASGLFKRNIDEDNEEEIKPSKTNRKSSNKRKRKV